MKTFIGEWMEHFNLTSEQLGETSGISPKIITRWLREETTPSVAQLDIISKALRVSMDDLIRLNPGEMTNEHIDVDDEQSNRNISQPIISTMLKEWANKFDVTADEISAQTKLPVDSIKSWMDKRTSPSLMEASIIAASFGISVDDLLTKSPDDFYADYLNNHYLETKDIKVAVRVQNWMKHHRIKNEIVVFKTKEKEIFMVRYTSKSALEPIDIIKISTRRKYRDAREKIIDFSSRYRGMEVVNIDE